MRQCAADDHLLARRATDSELRVARRAAGHVDDAADERLPPVVTVDDGDPVSPSQPHTFRRGSTVDKELAWYRSRAQQLPVHVEEIARARVQPEPRSSLGQRRPLDHMRRPACDRHGQ